MSFLYIDTYSIPTPSQAKQEMKIEVKNRYYFFSFRVHFIMNRKNILSEVSSIVFDKYWKSEIKMEIDQMFALFKKYKATG